MIALATWGGEGRPLTPTARLRRADARDLAERLDTGDNDPATRRTPSGEPAPGPGTVDT